MPGDSPRKAGRAVSGGHMFKTARMPGGVPLRRRLAILGGCAAIVPTLLPGAARAAEEAIALSTTDVIQLSLVVGVMGAALLSAVVLIRERARIAAENVELRSRVADLNAALQRSEALLNLRDQRVIVWSAENKKPELVGVLPAESGAPEDRAGLRAVQTPQGFRRAVLEQAHAAAGGLIATDDAGLVELLGIKVAVVPGSEEAFKVTRPIDLLLAEAVLARRHADGVR